MITTSHFRQQLAHCATLGQLDGLLHDLPAVTASRLEKEQLSAEWARRRDAIEAGQKPVMEVAA